jgi:ParB family transcriptional regulator, chromosome partitioning protein
MPRRTTAQRIAPVDGSDLSASVPARSTVEHIRLDDIVLSPRNPRHKLGDIEELAASIRTYGLLQPVVVRRNGKKYELVAGHRRLAALREIEWSEVPAVVREESADRAYLLTLIENLQRDDLSPREQAEALVELMRARNWSTHQVAEAIHRSQAYVSKRIRVFDDPVLKSAVLDNGLSISAAEELLALHPDQRQAVVNRALVNGWDQARVRAAVRAELGSTSAPSPNTKLRTQVENLRKTLRDIHLADLAPSDRNALRRLFADLAMIARAPTERRAPVFPSLPKIKASTRRRRGRSA